MKLEAMRIGRLWLVSLLALAPALAAPNPELRCIERARERTLLEEQEGERLCRGAGSSAPVDCYRAAHSEALLSDREAIELCRCADSTPPVACFRDARGAVSSELREALRLCSPTTARNLSPQCRPVVPVR